MSKSCLVALTGASGFIGSHILTYLLAENIPSKLLIRSPNKLKLESSRATIVEGDLFNQNALEALVKDTQVLIHCAGRVKGNNKSQFHQDNYIGTQNLLSVCKKAAHIEKIIFISSLSAREPHLSPYAESKYACEQLLESSNIPHIIIRPPAVYGPHDLELAPLFNHMKRGILWVPGNKQKRFSLIHVEDLCQLILASILLTGKKSIIIEPDDGHANGYDWEDIKTIAEEYFGRSITLFEISPRILSGIAILNMLFSKLLNYSPMLTPSKIRELLHENWVTDRSKISPDWTAEIGLRQGLDTLFNQKFTKQ